MEKPSVYRRFLLDNNIVTLSPGNGTRSANSSSSDFENNMVVILAGLLCALICVLGLNSILRCALRCCRRFRVHTPEQELGQLGSSVGMKEEALSHIPVEVYRAEIGIGLTGECPICLGEFVEGEKVRILPKCRHGFHVKCIDKWLSSNSSCPTCRTSLV